MASCCPSAIIVVPTGGDEFVDGGSVTGGNIVLTRNVGGDISFALGSIDEHSDVDTTTTLPADTDVLTWVAANSRWEPAASGGGGGSNAPVAAINGLTENINAFSTLTYSQFDTSDRTTQTWLTPAASNQTITEAGDYIVEFSVRDTVGSKDFTVKPSRAIGVATIQSFRGNGSWTGTLRVNWTGTDVTNGDSIIFVVTNNLASLQSVIINCNITKIA